LLDESVVKRVMTAVKCTACGEHFKADDVDVLARVAGLWFLKVSCSSCHTQSLAAAMEEDIVSQISDFTEAEQDKFEGAGAVTDDYLVMVHDFLRDFEGDFAQLFEESKA